MSVVLNNFMNSLLITGLYTLVFPISSQLSLQLIKLVTTPVCFCARVNIIKIMYLYSSKNDSNKTNKKEQKIVLSHLQI